MRKRVATIVLGLTLATGAWTGCSGEDASRMLDGALEAERAGELAEAERLYAETAAALARRRDGGGPDLVRALTGEARVKTARGDIEGALPLFQRALDLQMVSLEPDAPERATAYYRVATAYQSAGRTAEARALHEQALLAGEAAHGTESLELCETLNSLGLLELFDGRLDDAERYLRRSLEIMRGHLLVGHPNFISAHGNLGQVLGQRGDIAAAEEQYRLAIEAAQMNALPSRAASARNNLAGMLRDAGRLEEAEAEFLTAVDELQPVAERYPVPLASALGGLGLIYRQQRRYGEAETYYLQAVEILEPLGQSSDLASSLFNLARLYERQSRLDEATPILERSIAMFEATDGPQSRSLATALDGYVALLRALDRGSEADAAAERARSIRATRQ